MATFLSIRLALPFSAVGAIDLYNNWLTENWVDVHGTLEGTINSLDNMEGADPGFVEFSAKNYHLSASSDCVDEGAELPSDLLPNHSLNEQYVMHQGYTIRLDNTSIDMAAFETENN